MISHILRDHVMTAGHHWACLLTFYPEFEAKSIVDNEIIFCLDCSNSLKVWMFVYGTDLVQHHTRPHSRICSWLNNHPKKGVVPVSLTYITKHSQGCTLMSKTGATPPRQLLSLSKPMSASGCNIARDLYRTLLFMIMYMQKI